MSKFTGPLIIAFTDPGYQARLFEQLVWEAGELGSGRVVTMPIGFVSDGATVPRILWWFLPPWGDLATRAAILHDWLRTQISLGLAEAWCSRWQDADWEFYLALRSLKVGKLRAGACYLAARGYSIHNQLMALYVARFCVHK